jgi:F0F1-type ATP synthase assembly protein I
VSKNEKIKEQIGWLKLIFAIFSAIVVSLIGWIATHYEKASLDVYIALFLVVIISISLVQINRKAYKKMDELEEL